jgi:DNA ligase-1
MVDILPPQVDTSGSDRKSRNGSFGPMLSAKLPCMEMKDRVPTEQEVIDDLKRLDWSEGFLCSPKLDGIRAMKDSSLGLVSRSLKLIPNKWIQSCLSPTWFNGLDGELVIGDVKNGEFVNFNDTQSGVMSRDGSPFFTFCVFDSFLHPNVRFDWRTSYAEGTISGINESEAPQGFKVIHVEQEHIRDIDALFRYEERIVQLGYEGIIIRHPGKRYKFGRSTFREHGMVKIKRFEDAEAEIIGFEELYHNNNPQVADNFGLAKRSSHLENQIPGNTLGRLVVIGINSRFRGVEFKVGSGFDSTLRDTIWQNRPKYKGRIVKYKFQDHGAKNKPRTPIFLGFRSLDDL